MHRRRSVRPSRPPSRRAAPFAARQGEGSLSRHGVLHGRELAYDTRVNSARTWSVLDALVEWALPKARELVDARKVERQAKNAGSQDLDERERRVDDREFSETRDALRLLATSAMGWYRQRGVFRADPVGGVNGTDDLTKRASRGAARGGRMTHA
jgi:hypothetical protein